MARRVDGLIVEKTGSELLVYRDSTQEAHGLNETASIVFELCDGETSREAMAAEVSARTGLPADIEIVDLALNELVEAGVVTVDTEIPGITRRTLIRRLSLTAAVGALLPVVDTVIMPSVAAAQSVPTTFPTSTTSTTTTYTTTTTTTSSFFAPS